jgi:hypothetical protein
MFVERSHVHFVFFSRVTKLYHPDFRGTHESRQNQDILNLIFEHFNFQPGSKTAAQTRKDLLSAAKVCKAFVEPAMNSLWRILPSLLPLLLLLPSAEVSNNRYVSPSPSSYLPHTLDLFHEVCRRTSLE